MQVAWMTWTSAHEFELETAVRLLLASLFGGLIGIEREMKGRPAGLKTFSLVCIGAALIMITNIYICERFGYGGDVTRMAAQVISGIGFLGAGTIMVTGRSQVKGLTTAAALWGTAALGICIGSGFYLGGILGVTIMFGTAFIYRYLDRRIIEKARLMRIYIEGTDEKILMRLLDYFNVREIRVQSLQRRPENMWSSKNTSAMVEFELPKRKKHDRILEELKAIPDVIYVEELL